MSTEERVVDVDVSGSLSSGHTFTIHIHDVHINQLKNVVEWCSKALPEAGVLPSPAHLNAGGEREDNQGDTRICPLHHERMYKRTSGGEVWYSHKVRRQDGSTFWCRGE